jgi:hypothetical protein
MRSAFMILVLTVLVVGAQAAEVYKWVDDKGVVNFTDDYNKIPPAYRNQVRLEGKVEEPPAAPSGASPGAPAPVPVQTPAVAGQAPGSAQTDRYGLGEAYWRDRAKPWKEKYREASQKYDEANKRYQEKADELSQRRFGSPTQYKMNIAQLDQIKVEREGYKAEMTEAEEALKKIAKDAQESGGNPEWVK